MTITSKNLIEQKVLTRFLCSTNSWFRDDMVLVVSLCRVSHYQTTSHMPVPSPNSSR